MTLKQIRANARESLTGKWGKAALMTLLIMIILGVASAILGLIPVIGNIAGFVLTIPAGYGYLVSFMKLKRGEEVGYTDFITIGYSSFAKSWKIFGNIILKLIVPIVLTGIFTMIIIFGGAGTAIGAITTSNSAVLGFSGIMLIGVIGYMASSIYFTVKSYLYVLAYSLAYDNPEKSAKELVEESANLMKGNRWKYFWLPVTFIGWMFLVPFTLGIGMLWLTPYMLVAGISFYEDLVGMQEPKVIDSVDA